MARGAFWTIIVDDQPTAFRAPVREDLLPTLKQLQRQHPNAVIKWFQRGRLWETPGDAMDASKPPRRGPDWRPGGAHKDPREQYKVPRDVKRARWASQAAEGRGPWVEKSGPKGGRARADAASMGRPPRRESATGGEGRPERPRADRPPRDDRPREMRRDDRPRADGTRAFKPKGGHRGPGTGNRGAGTGNRGPGNGSRGAGTGNRQQATGHRGPGTGNREPATGNRGPGTGNRKPAAGSRGPGARPGGPRQDWRGDRGERRDAVPRAGGEPPKPAAKKARTWRVGELPPADRKRKKDD